MSVVLLIEASQPDGATYRCLGMQIPSGFVDGGSGPFVLNEGRSGFAGPPFAFSAIGGLFHTSGILEQPAQAATRKVSGHQLAEPACGNVDASHNDNGGEIISECLPISQPFCGMDCRIA